MKYEVVMGLEVHVELSTKSKLFCTCSAEFGAKPNEHVCPACAGMPGLLPITNKKAIELGMKAAIVTNSEITSTISFDKKNYFYPDLPTGYQITQLFAPICRSGYVDIQTEEGEKRITLKQIHIEEDAGKLVHDSFSGSSLVDYNRAGVPLVEIVSNPDFRSADEVIAYLEKLRSLLVYADISDCKMQEGSMRADINLSVREAGSEVLGTRTEMKNMNSLKAIVRAIQYESERHIEALETGSEELIQETRRWDDAKNMSFSMRNKEDATDYRYFPNTDVMPIYIDSEWIQKVKEDIPEMAKERSVRYMTEYNLSEYDSNLLVSSKNLSDIFEETVKICKKPKEAANWLLGDLMNLSKKDGIHADDVVMDATKIAAIIGLVENKTINRTIAREIFERVYSDGIDPKQYIEEQGLSMVSDEDDLRKICEEVISDNPKVVEDYKKGNQKVIGFFVGNVMKRMGGKANPQIVNQIVKELLSKLD
ncbi:MAG: Asp-tRNA(Asn)/Glu-tRNA(Gln) amidotransferase subunit GatB [Lachnoclostridium sp.]|nr:Asp-tRNA(Asn)/Glu-tRNA(Gln) amidotransferase subunit GatB [Lachnoclostridium sp.]